MMSNLRKIVVSIWRAIWLPTVVYFGAGLIMILASGHTYVRQQLKEKATPDQKTPLYMRWRGYNTNEVDQHWGVFDERALKTERRFLQLDLLFPLFYGGAFVIALWRVWAELGKMFSPVLFIAPAAITILADWMENLIQLTQLRRYVEMGKDGLQAGWLQIASAATATKLLFFFVTLGFLVYLAIYRVVRRRE